MEAQTLRHLSLILFCNIFAEIANHNLREGQSFCKPLEKLFNQKLIVAVFSNATTNIYGTLKLIGT